MFCQDGGATAAALFQPRCLFCCLTLSLGKPKRITIKELSGVELKCRLRVRA